MKELILASQSPRRRELMETLHYPFLTIPAVGEEIIDPSLAPSDLVQKLAQQKAEEISQQHPKAVVIGADTLVVLGTEIFGKPKTQEEAWSMLRKLQGTSHQVYTGVCVCEGSRTECFYSCTQVSVRSLNATEVKNYVAQGESMDKAGAYGIQGKGAWLIDRVEGDYFNVVGLPLCQLGQKLETFSIPLFGSEGQI